MVLEVKDIIKMEKEAVELRKSVLIEKMEVVYEFSGNYNGDVFIKYLKDNTNFKCGCCVDFDNFKKDFLTSPFRLDEFNKKFLNSGFDYDEFHYIGFNDNLRIVDETEIYDVFYEEITNYNFTNKELNDFEEFVDSEFKKDMRFRY